jgi:hypothetical protein
MDKPSNEAPHIKRSVGEWAADAFSLAVVAAWSRPTRTVARMTMEKFYHLSRNLVIGAICSFVAVDLMGHPFGSWIGGAVGAAIVYATIDWGRAK